MTMHRMIAALALTVTTLLAAPDGALAQGSRAAPGPKGATRVRVSTNIPNVRPEGRLTFASADSLVVADAFGLGTRILRANITAVDTSAGLTRRPWQGLGIGILAGGAAGMIIGFADGDDDPHEFMSMTASDKALWGAGIFGAVGGIVGLGAGSLIRTDRWKRSSLERLSIAAMPSRGGGLSLAFQLRLGR